MDELLRTGDILAVVLPELDRDPALKSEHTRRGYKADLHAFEAWRKKRFQK